MQDIGYVTPVKGYSTTHRLRTIAVENPLKSRQTNKSKINLIAAKFQIFYSFKQVL